MRTQINNRSRSVRQKGFGTAVISGLLAVLAVGLIIFIFKPPPPLPHPLRVGYAIEAPYAYLTTEGRVSGQLPEIARQVAARLGQGEPQWVLTEFGSLISQLRAGRFDVVAAGLFITPERERLVAFSHPALTAEAGLLVLKHNPAALHAYQDAVQSPDTRLAGLAGSVEVKALTRLGMPASRLIIVPDVTSGLSLLKSAKVSGFALSQPTVKWLGHQPTYAGMFEPAAPFRQTLEYPPHQVAFAFRQEDTHLRQAWDRAMAAFMQTEDYHTLMRHLDPDAESSSKTSTP